MKSWPKITISLMFGLIIVVKLSSCSTSGWIQDLFQDPDEIDDLDSWSLGYDSNLVVVDPVYNNNSCSDGWILNSNSTKCLREFSTTQSWAESLEFCREFGGDLASLHSVTDFVLAKSLVYADTWIGLNDIATDGIFEWSDSSAVDFTSWASGQPNNEDGTANCVALSQNANFDFTENSCSEQKRFLCEKSKDTESQYRCPEGWILNLDSSKCFRSINSIQTWPESLSFCREFNGDLVSLHSETEFVLAKSLITEDTWIGLNDIAVEGRMEWSDSSVVDFTSWGTGEPNNGNGPENCIDLNESLNFEFADAVCTYTKRFLCEKINDGVLEYQCPEGWVLNSDSNKCFREFGTTQSWAEGLTFCRDFGGDLASLHSETDFVLAKSLISEDTWIGLNDIEIEGEMAWSDSSDVDFTSWAFGEPNDRNASNNCVEMGAYVDFDFIEDACSEKKRFLCEKIVEGVEPLYRCPEDWILNSDSTKCLRLFSTFQTWAESVTFCRDFGGDLASLHSETDFVLAKSLADALNSSSAWIGLNDIMTEGIMEWSDSSPVDFTRWYSGEPNNQNGTENCVQMQASFNFEFNDIECSEMRSFLCEIITGYEEVEI